MQDGLFQMHPNKYPGLEDFSLLVSQSQWDVVDKLFTSICLRVLNDELDVAFINRTLVALIQKINNPLCVSQFCSIDLFNVIYKLISNCLTHRKEPAIDSII